MSKSEESTYHELTITPSSHIELFSDFLSDVLPIGFESTDESLIVRSEESLENIAWGVEQYADALQNALNTQIDVTIESELKENQEWVEIYQNAIEPITIEPFHIHPTWVKPDSTLLNITIDPSLAFGTGHHPTTASCLKAIAKYQQDGSKVLDVGCGSGILSIASAKLGGVVDACDTDPVCISNTAQNAKLNSIDLNLWKGSIARSTKQYDLIIANIVADVLHMIAPELISRLKCGAILILSGILDRYEDKILSSFDSLSVIEIMREDEWVSIVATNKE